MLEAIAHIGELTKISEEDIRRRGFSFTWGLKKDVMPLRAKARLIIEPRYITPEPIISGTSSIVIISPMSSEETQECRIEIPEGSEIRPNISQIGFIVLVESILGGTDRKDGAILIV